MGSFEMKTLRLAGLGIGAKIGLIMGLMAIPLGLMTYLFIAQARKDVDFAALEMAGSKALVGIWNGAVLATAPDQRPAAMATLAKDISEAIPSLEDQFQGRCRGQGLLPDPGGIGIGRGPCRRIQDRHPEGQRRLEPDARPRRRQLLRHGRGHRPACRNCSRPWPTCAAPPSPSSEPRPSRPPSSSWPSCARSRAWTAPTTRSNPRSSPPLAATPTARWRRPSAAGSPRS